MLAGPEEIAVAVSRLRAGGLVAFPTETVYGLGADALNERAVRRVFEVKGRPSNNPLIVHVSGAAMARGVVANWPDEAQKLAAKFWPGPLSLVLPKAPHVPGIVTAGGPNVAVRCPDHPTTLSLLEAFGGPLVGPSANPSGRVSPTRAEHVRESFSEEQAYVLDGGPCRGGIESTVVKVAEQVTVLRLGLIGAEVISRAIGQDVQIAHPTSEVLESPGQLPSHYAPRTPVVLCRADEVARTIARARSAVVISYVHVVVAPPHHAIDMPRDARGYAAALYQTLRAADRAGGEVIVIVRPEVAGDADERGVWAAVLNRVERAAAPR